MKIKYRKDRTNARLIWDICDEEISNGETLNSAWAENIAGKRGLNAQQVKTELSAWKKARRQMAEILNA